MLQGDWFERWKLSVTHFPDELQCPKCLLFAINDEVIDQIVETSGGSEANARMRLEAARCICQPRFQPRTEQQTRLPYKEDSE